MRPEFAGMLVSKSILRAGWSPWGIWEAHLSIPTDSKWNRARSPSVWAVSREVSKPVINSVSPSQTRHSHRIGSKGITVTSSSCGRRFLAIQRICNADSQHSSP